LILQEYLSFGFLLGFVTFEESDITVVVVTAGVVIGATVVVVGAIVVVVGATVVVVEVNASGAPPQAEA